jgi:hypothetical protein
MGGILGGLVAERVTAWFDTSSVLLWLALLHFLGAAALVTMRTLARRQRVKVAGTPRKENEGSARVAFAKAPYLFSLAALVLIGTTTAAAVDWVFKAQRRRTTGAASR